jgi:hypothetical protein
MPAAMRESPFVANFGMPKGLDEQYTWMSFGTLLVFALIARDLLLLRKPALAPVGEGATDGREEIAEKVAAAEVLVPVVAQSSRPQGAGHRSKRRRR